MSKTQADLIESIKNEFNTVLYSDIENHKDIVNIIQNNKPKELEDKYKTLTTNGMNVSLEPRYIRVGKRFIRAEWWLISH